MKTIWVKYWYGKKWFWSVGVCLRAWALPLEIDFQDDNAFSVTLFCFYLEVGRHVQPDLADRMVGTLKK